MTLGVINHGDIVRCDVKGRRFMAWALTRDGRQLKIKPMDKGITYRTVTGNQVVGWWSRRKGTEHVFGVDL